MKWIGLTGGIASGKSQVTKILREKLIPVIDADAVSYEITQVNAEGYLAIRQYFGEQVLNEDLSLNRKKLGEIVFNDNSKKLELEKLLHPLIQKRVAELKLSYSHQAQPFCFYDVPLLFEKNLESQFDQIVFVYAPLTVQIDRLMKRNSLNYQEALTRIHSQLMSSYKVKNSHFCLDNSTSLEDLELQIDFLLKKIS